MRIALDATYSLGNDLSGVGIYSREMLAGLAAEHPGAKFLFCYRPHRFVRSFDAALPHNCRRFPLGEYLAPSFARLFHGLNQRLPKVRLRRAISTFHDLFVITGDYSTPEFRRRFEQQARHAASASDLIIAVSEFTARQVHELLGVEQARLRVVRHGVRFPVCLRADSAEPAPKGSKTVLHVGAIQKRKNLVRLVRAFGRLAPGWRLVLAGSSGYGAEEVLREIEASPRREHIRVAGYVSSRELEQLYREAHVFAFPSLDEGFGMPVLEAMAAGVPVLASNRSALPEVCGDAALLVDPTDVDAISAGLSRLSIDGNLRRLLVERGHQRATEFTWERAVRETWSVYKELG